MNYTFLKRDFLISFLIFFWVVALSNLAQAASAREIDVSVDEALKRFYSHSKNGKELAEKARGVLVFPRVIKAGFVFGGEYGEGALRVNGKTVDYYSTMAASWGFQLGAQSKTLLMLFMTKNALNGFRGSEGWEVGVDGSVALVTVGAGGYIDTENIKSPVIGVAFGQKGLMYNLTLEGTKITKLDKK